MVGGESNQLVERWWSFLCEEMHVPPLFCVARVVDGLPPLDGVIDGAVRDGVVRPSENPG